MLDIAVLLQILTPALPFLVKVGGKATEGAGQKIGEDVWAKAKAVWIKLSPKVEADPVAKKAVEKVANDLENADRLTAAKLALQDLLEEHPDLAKELAELLRDAPTQADGIQVNQSVQGNQNQTIGVMQGGNAIGSVQGNVSL